jgi:hypothetical protein
MPGKKAARHVRPDGRSRRRLGAALVAAAAVAVVAVVGVNLTTGWSVDSLLSDSNPTATDGHESSPGSGNASPTHRHRRAPAAQGDDDGTSNLHAAQVTSLRVCAVRVANAQRVIAAAGEGVGHWRQHIQARTDMLKGRISEKRMERVWERTQRAGPADQRHFRATVRHRPSESHCGQPRTYPPDLRRMAHQCLIREAATGRGLRAAHGAMRDWRVHLANMAKFSRGRMSAAMAQGRWVQAWRNAPIHITAYRSARAALDRAPACTMKGNQARPSR